jgi:hypothetical protein
MRIDGSMDNGGGRCRIQGTLPRGSLKPVGYVGNCENQNAMHLPCFHITNTRQEVLVDEPSTMDPRVKTDTRPGMIGLCWNAPSNDIRKGVRPWSAAVASAREFRHAQ